MKRPLVYVLALSSISVLLFALLIYHFTTNIDPQTIGTEAAAGKKVWESKGCIECHAVFGNGGYAAPDLTKTFAVRGENWLADFFRDPPMRRPSNKKRHLGLSDKEIPEMIQYLRSVSQIRLLDWPPAPILPPSREGE